jgi:FkbM family methyltransferase
MTFYPFVRKHGIDDLYFYVSTEEAERWYSPPKPYVLLEYEWVLEHIPLEGKIVVDGGANHGHYSVVLGRKGPIELHCVEPVPENAAVLKKNLALNATQAVLHSEVLWSEEGEIGFNMGMNGSVDGGGPPVKAARLQTLVPNAEVVKLDIEGIEFLVLPDAVANMGVESWIVETHIGAADPNLIAKLFLDHGYQVDWVNREKMRVEPYRLGTYWESHSTLFARRQ